MRVLRFIACLALCLGCKKAELDETLWKQRGAEAVQPYKRNLKKGLVDGMAKGPEHAIAACRTMAPQLAAEASSVTVTIGRTSHKLRNPENAPKPWMRPLLDAYRAQPSDREPRVVSLGDRVGYVEPIFVQPRCVVCHGKAIAPAIQGRLDELYADDQAIGFVAGDFRGLFWAELKVRE